MPQTLAQMVRAKHPGAYDDLDDATLESSVTAKYPGVYDDIPRSTLPTRPVSAEDFMRPEDIANRDNGTSIAGDIARGFGKRAASSIAGIGEMAAASGMIPGVRSDPFNPVMRHPVFTRTDALTAPKNDAERTGGRMELAAELAGPAISAVKALPTLARGAASMAKSVIDPVARGLASDTPLLTQARQAIVKKVLSRVLDSGSTANKGGRLVTQPSRMSAEEEIADALGDVRSLEPPPSVELPPPAALPPGYAPRSTVPPVGPPAAATPPVAPQGRLVSAPARPTIEDELAGAVAEARAPVPPQRVTTPPPAELPAGYTPRTTVPKPKAAPKPAPEPPAPPKAATEVELPKQIEAIKAKHPSLDILDVRSLKNGDLRLETMAVSKGGQGVGTAAMNELTAIADANGQRMTLSLAEKGYSPVTGAKTTSPERLKEFYKRFGFVENKGRNKDFSISDAMYRPARGAVPKAVAAPTTQPARRAYFLKSPEAIAAERAVPESVTPSGSITIDDLPEAWKARTGQDLFPTTGAEAKEITAAFRAEIKERGMTIGQAIAAVSKNRDIPTRMRAQIIRSLSGGGKSAAAEAAAPAKAMKAVEPADYRGMHTAPMRNSGASLDDLTGKGTIYPDDVYGPQGQRYYGDTSGHDATTFKIVHKFKGKPDAEVTIYRAAPKDAPDDINRGDWVSVNRGYAKMHGEGPMKGDYKIVSKKVKARDIFTNGDSIHEWGYDPSGGK